MNGGRKEYRQSAEKLLRKAYENSNRKRGLVLALTSGMLVLLGMLLLGFIQGKIRADQLRYQRENGSVVDTYVENGTEKTAEILKNFQMVRQIGLEKICGKLMDNGIVYCECSVMEEQDWEKLKAAAYTDIYGAYPEEANEIMLSQKTLEFLEIHQPEIGMELSLEFHWNSVFIVKGTGRQNFILSGYYTDYRKDASNFSTAYLSKKKLEQADLTEFPCRILLDMKDSLRSGEQTEMLLRESIALGEDEYFVSEDSAFYKSVRGIAGSFGIGAFLLILLVLCAVLLIYQLIRISFLRDVRQYGIMRTIGVTVKQIRRVVYRQVLWDIFKGTILGGVLSCLIIGCVFPAMMTKMYMGEAGEMENASFLSVPFCAGYALVVCMIGFVTASRSFRVLFRANAAETMGLMETKRMSKKKKRFSLPRRKRPEDLWKKRKSFLMEMAWKSIGNSRRSFAFSILIVSLGGIAALCTVSLTSGTDLIRKLEKNPEFRIGITYNCYDFLSRREPDIWEMDFFPEDLRKQLEKFAEQVEGRTEVKKGYLLSWFDTNVFSFAEEKEAGSASESVIEGEMKDRMISGLYRYSTDKPQGIIYVLSEEEEDRLLKRISSQREALKEGEAVLLHQGMPFQEKVKEHWKETVFQVKDTTPAGTLSSETIKHVSELTVVECVDLLKTDLSDFDLFWEEENTCWMMVSEETFQALSEKLYQRVLEVDVYVPGEQERNAEEAIRKEVDRVNREFQTQYGVDAELVTLTCKSDVIVRETRYLKNSRICMAAVCAMLFLLGILTYASARYMDLVMREKEMKTLEILGVTGKQQRDMVRLEGVFHSVVIVTLLGIVGNGVIALLDRIVQEQSKYFSAVYPWGAFILLAALLLGVSWILPEGFKRIRKNK